MVSFVALVLLGAVITEQVYSFTVHKAVSKAKTLHKTRRFSSASWAEETQQRVDGDLDDDDYDNNENDDDEPMVMLRSQQQQRCIKGVAPKTCPLNEAVSRLVDVSLEEANRLIEIGAVWARMDTLSEDDILMQYETSGLGTSMTSAQYADLPRGWGAGDAWTEDASQEGDLEAYVQKMQTQRYRRILTSGMIEGGTDMKVYPNPRRFSSCYELTKDRLLYQDTTFVVVDKPPMLPTQPDASNYLECCPGCVNELMGPFQTIDGEPVDRPLLCHRIDACVGGCVVLSKDRYGQKVFHDLQRERKIKKVYLAVTNRPVPVGMHLHWMWAPQTARGKSGGPPCQLVSTSTPESRRKARVSTESACVVSGIVSNLRCC